MTHLVLTRRIGEKIIIGDNIEVHIHKVEANGMQVRIGITAPSNVRIMRPEVLERAAMKEIMIKEDGDETK